MSFTFRDFHIDDTHCAMKVGTDAMLLGALAPLPPPDGARPLSALDLGAGCGILSLMLAQRHPSIRVTAVESDTDAASDCAANFAASTWAQRLDCLCADALTAGLPVADLIVSNPPFYRAQVSCPDTRREASRRAADFSPEAVLDIAADRLTSDGKVALILPHDDLSRLLADALLRRLYPTSIVSISTRAGKSPVRAVVTLGRHELCCCRTSLDIRTADNLWSQAYIDLTRDFYLRIPRP